MLGVAWAKSLIRLESFLSAKILIPRNNWTFHVYVKGHPFFEGLVSHRTLTIGPVRNPLDWLNRFVPKAIRTPSIDGVLQHL